ncbi:hypothetical protein BJY52DRAFT_1227916 [Lactarius psammicola]|nr:hypothetical protein BJY52DRAFT_1227916 [Lactarius psammicola]
MEATERNSQVMKIVKVAGGRLGEAHGWEPRAGLPCRFCRRRGLACEHEQGGFERGGFERGGQLLCEGDIESVAIDWGRAPRTVSESCVVVATALVFGVAVVEPTALGSQRRWPVPLPRAEADCFWRGERHTRPDGHGRVGSGHDRTDEREGRATHRVRGRLESETGFGFAGWGNDRVGKEEKRGPLLDGSPSAASANGGARRGPGRVESQIEDGNKLIKIRGGVGGSVTGMACDRQGKAWRRTQSEGEGDGGASGAID